MKRAAHGTVQFFNGNQWAWKITFALNKLLCEANPTVWIRLVRSKGNQAGHSVRENVEVRIIKTDQQCTPARVWGGFDTCFQIRAQGAKKPCLALVEFDR